MARSRKLPPRIAAAKTELRRSGLSVEERLAILRKIPPKYRTARQQDDFDRLRDVLRTRKRLEKAETARMRELQYAARLDEINASRIDGRKNAGQEFLRFSQNRRQKILEDVNQLHAARVANHNRALGRRFDPFYAYGASI